MDSSLADICGRSVLFCSSAGPRLSSAQDANIFLEEAWAIRATMLVIPVSRLGEGFFDLSFGVAGNASQKFATYRMQVAIIGDIARWTTSSDAFRDFVREANRGSLLWFVRDHRELAYRIGRVRDDDRI